MARLSQVSLQPMSTLMRLLYEGFFFFSKSLHQKHELCLWFWFITWLCSWFWQMQPQLEWCEALCDLLRRWGWSWMKIPRDSGSQGRTSWSTEKQPWSGSCCCSTSSCWLAKACSRELVSWTSSTLFQMLCSKNKGDDDDYEIL